jgi:hypothetical protein
MAADVAGRQTEGQEAPAGAQAHNLRQTDEIGPETAEKLRRIGGRRFA